MSEIFKDGMVPLGPKALDPARRILKGIALKPGLRTVLNPVVRVTSFTVRDFIVRLRFDNNFILNFEFMATYSCEWFICKGIHYNKIR